MTVLAERLTISIPSDLYRRLQKVKADLNISKICQTAIESRVTFEEIYKQEKNQMQALIDKLRKEKEEIETNAHETGLKGGSGTRVSLVSCTGCSSIHPTGNCGS